MSHVRCNLENKKYFLLSQSAGNDIEIHLTFKRRIKSHLPFAGIIRSSQNAPRFQDKG